MLLLQGMTGQLLSNIEREYALGIWSESDAQTALSSLTVAERRLIILYAEMGSYAKLGRLLGCSAQSVYKRIKPIRIKLQKQLR